MLNLVMPFSMSLQICMVEKLYSLYTEVLKQSRVILRQRKDEFTGSLYNEMLYLIRRARSAIIDILNTIIHNCILNKILDIHHFEDNVDHHVQDYFHVRYIVYVHNFLYTVVHL